MDKMKTIIDKLTHGKGRVIVLLPLLLGILLLLLSASGYSSLGGGSDAADDVESLCSSVDGVGECRVMLNLDGEGEVCAVLVVCEGGDSLLVRQRLTALLSAYYGIGYHRICIEKSA